MDKIQNLGFNNLYDDVFVIGCMCKFSVARNTGNYIFWFNHIYSPLYTV